MLLPHPPPHLCRRTGISLQLSFSNDSLPLTKPKIWEAVGSELGLAIFFKPNPVGAFITSLIGFIPLSTKMEVSGSGPPTLDGSGRTCPFGVNHNAGPNLSNPGCIFNLITVRVRASSVTNPENRSPFNRMRIKPPSKRMTRVIKRAFEF